MHRRLDAGMSWLAQDRRAIIIDAVTDDWPAIVRPALDDVDFIAAAWAVLVHPDQAAARLTCNALNIAVATREDFRSRPRFSRRTDCRAARYRQHEFV